MRWSAILAVVLVLGTSIATADVYHGQAYTWRPGTHSLPVYGTFSTVYHGRTTHRQVFPERPRFVGYLYPRYPGEATRYPHYTPREHPAPLVFCRYWYPHLGDCGARDHGRYTYPRFQRQWYLSRDHLPTIFRHNGAYRYSMW